MEKFKATDVKKLLIEPNYKKANGAWALDTQNTIVSNEFSPVEQALVLLPPEQIAGNHKHVRREALLGLGKGAYFLWQGDNGELHEEQMNPEGQVYLFVIPPNVPHAVVNKSSHEPAVLYEYFDDVYRDVERVNLVG